jgi:hypothetical protein
MKRKVKRRAPTKPKKVRAKSRSKIRARKRPVIKSRKKRNRTKVTKRGAKKSTSKRRVRKRLDDINRAKLVVKKLKSRTLVYETHWLTPTKQGFNRIDEIMGEIYGHEKGRGRSKDITIYSFSLYITFTGPDGKPVNKRSEGIGIGIPSKIQAQKGTSKKAKFLLSIRQEIRLKIYGLLSEHFDLISPGKHKKMGRMSEKQANKMMRDIRENRNTRFKLIIYRQDV